MTANPFLKRAAAKNIGEHGRKSEARVAKTLGARLQPASGAMARAKGDMKMQRKHKFLAESKSTTADQLKIDLGWLMKITAESLAQNASPLLTISFVTPEGRLRGLKEDWVCMPRHVFDELTKE